MGAADPQTRMAAPGRHQHGRSPSALALIAVMLMLGGGGAWLASGRLPGPRAEVLPGNQPVNAGAADELNLDANNSPRIVANPKNPSNLVVVNRVDLPRFGCALSVSFDAGASWAPTPMPSLDDTTLCFVPDAAFGADGRLFVSYATIDTFVLRGAATEALWVASSGDGGRTLSSPAQAAGALTYQPRLVTDPSRPRRLYLSWLQAAEATDWGVQGEDNPIVVARSEDAGTTWSAPVRVSSPSHGLAVAPSPVVGDRGELFVAYLDLGKDRLDYIGAHEGRAGPVYPGPWSLVVARSTDGGTTWSAAVVDDHLVPVERILMAFVARPSVAVRGQRVYVAFHDASSGDADVLLWASPDRGANWGRPTRVNDTPRGDATEQYLPAVAVAPNGRVDLVYYDRRSDRRGFMNEVSLQSSHDGGDSFGTRLRLSSRPFDSRIGFNSNRKLAQLGDRIALRATDTGDLAVWADTRGGIALTGKQDLARAVVVFSSPSSAKSPLRYSGMVIGLAGLAMLAWAVVLRGSRRPGQPSSAPLLGR